MNRLIRLSALLMISLVQVSDLRADCTDSQSRVDMNISIQRLHEAVAAGGNHGFMDKILIGAPVQVEEFSLVGMEVTRGKMAEFWIPLDYEIRGRTASTAIVGFADSIQGFEVAVNYQAANGCEQLIQRLIR